MDAHMIALWVTLEQETAIEALFQARRWIYQKLDAVRPLLASCSGSEVQHTDSVVVSDGHSPLYTAHILQQTIQTPIHQTTEILNYQSQEIPIAQIQKISVQQNQEIPIQQTCEISAQNNGKFIGETFGLPRMQADTTENTEQLVFTSDAFQPGFDHGEGHPDSLSINNTLQLKESCAPDASQNGTQIFKSKSTGGFKSDMPATIPKRCNEGSQTNLQYPNHGNQHLTSGFSRQENIKSFNVENDNSACGHVNAGKVIGDQETDIVDMLQEFETESGDIHVFDGLQNTNTYTDQGVGFPSALINGSEQQNYMQHRNKDVDTDGDAFLESVCSQADDIKKESTCANIVNETNVDSDNIANITTIPSVSEPEKRSNRHIGDSDGRLEIENGRAEENVTECNISKSDDPDGYSCEIYCKDCEHTFKYKRSYEKHLAENKCRHVCSVCGKIFLFGATARYRIHMNYHLKKKPHVCNVCGSSYVEKSKLMQHLNKHTGAKPFMCDHCGQTYTSYPNLYSHIQTRHPKTVESLQCDKCLKVFRRTSSLLYHQKHYHSSDGSIPQIYTCKVCEKTFRTPDLLKRHETVHRDTKDFVCNICGTAFIRVQDLTAHRKRHMKEYAHFCMWCKKGFYTKSLLSMHTRMHTGEKPFSCSVCDYRCSRKENLTKHVKKHK